MTDRLKLRALNLSDVDQLFRIYSDKEAMKYRRSKAMKSAEDARLFVENRILRKDGVLVERKGVELTNKKLLIGSVMFRFDDKESDQCEIGYSIGREYWSRGYGSLIVKLIVDHMKTEKGVKKLIAWTMKENVASTKILAKNGFKKIKQNQHTESHLFERRN
ncbi:GNAT family N-acetyltransferase [Saprospiraceae bacterium]|nr:GNAT family N-acetyltransferase [Saprospiraceae bacterium]